MVNLTRRYKIEETKEIKNEMEIVRFIRWMNEDQTYTITRIQ